ncbi:MAG: SemiSWEET transporter [Bacteroidales bacterium]|nr:SemiSWEET transporter [Bacteroidales bacterium]
MLKLVVGLFAASLTTIAFVPQAVKTWKTKSTDDLSPLMFGLFCTGVLGWLTYGIIISDIVIITANIITVSLAGSIMYFIIVQKKKRSINHVAIWVNDIELVKNFYLAFLDAKASALYTNSSKNFCSYFVTFTSGPKLELMSTITGSTNKSGCSGHFALSVGSKQKVDELVETCRGKGVVVVGEPRVTGDGFYEAVIADPEGNKIEITV